MLKSRMAPLSGERYALARSGLTGAPLATLSALSGLRGRSVSHLPETSFLTVRDPAGGSHHFTMLSNTAHSNVAELLGDKARRLPDEDDLLIVNGFVGAYPNAMFVVNADATAGVRRGGAPSRLGGRLPAAPDALRHTPHRAAGSGR